MKILSPKVVAVMFWICVGGFVLNAMLLPMALSLPGEAGGGKFAMNMVLFGIGAVANYLFLPKEKKEK